jgi:hypothetical protein
VGRPTVRKLRFVHVFPHYFCASILPSALPQQLDASPVVQKTCDEVGPTEPAEHRGKKQGEYIAYIQELQHPQSAPPLGSEKTKITGSELTSRDNRGLICEPSKHADLHTKTYEPLDHSNDSQHPRGAPFLGSVDVRCTKHVSEMLDFGSEEYGMIGDDKNLFTDASNPIDIADILADIRMDGTELFKIALCALVTEYRDIFSNDVGITPALVEPMKLAVNAEKWTDSKNRTPPRPQSRLAKEEICRQETDLMAHGVIEFSFSTEYSQVLMVKKKPLDPSLRFCLDFRRLNDATEYVDTWPLPNIKQMIERVGRRKPKYFGNMDLTAGYHQFGLAKDARVFTAFICFLGIFQWCRVPIGLKGAGSFFQRQMAMTVLVGLVRIICEV